MRKTKNITVSVDEATYRRARIRAAELDTSVSALVRDYLGSLVRDDDSGRSADMLDAPERKDRTEEDEFERQRRLMNEVIEEIRAKNSGFRAADNLSREELYDRAKAREEARQAAAVHRREHKQV